jgi:hypothetical protein
MPVKYLKLVRLPSTVGKEDTLIMERKVFAEKRENPARIGTALTKNR